MSLAETQVCPTNLLPASTIAACQEWQAAERTRYDCAGDAFLESMTPGRHAGVVANYLSFNTAQATGHFVDRAEKFEACTGGKILFTAAHDIAADPMKDLGGAGVPGTELFDAYLMIYSFTSEASHLGLLETLNDRVRASNALLRYEDIFAKVQSMGEYRKDGKTNIDLLMADGDFFVPVVRLDLLEKHGFPLPHTWDDLVNITKFFNGTDLNDDGEEDYGFCIYPRTGSGFNDAWIPELMYSTWGATDQTRGIQQGFFFDEETFEPRIGNGFEKAMNVWKDLWPNSADGCITPNFVHGRCAVGLAPPGCWKGTFVNAEGGGVAWRNPDWSLQLDENGEKLWQPRMKDGSYAEPYRMRPFGSLEVIDRVTDEFKECDPASCPKAERIKASSSLPPDDRARVLVDSPHVGKLVNRVPFYWSGGYGTGIRKSAAKEAKDLMWDFFVYVNTPITSVDDVVLPSWLDSWRHSQLNDCNVQFEGGECKFDGSCNFQAGGWGCDAFNEHKKTMEWALGNDVNSALTLRLPGVLTYTRDVLLDKFIEYMDGKIAMEDLKAHVAQGWIDATATRGKLDQVQIYRASLGLDPLSEFELCQLHRSDMDAKDNTVCVKYDEQATDNTNVIIIGVLVPVVVIILALAFIWIYLERKKRHLDAIWQINKDELKFDDPPEIAGRGTFGLVVKAEYRGTIVAVKRVIPPKGRANRTASLLETENPNAEESALSSGEVYNRATIPVKPMSKKLSGEGNASRDSGPRPPPRRASLDDIFVDKGPEPKEEFAGDAEISQALRRLTQDSADLEAGLAEIAAEHRRKMKAKEGGDDDKPTVVRVVEVDKAEISGPEHDNGASHPTLNSVETGATVLSSKTQSGTMSSQQASKAKWKRWFGYNSAGKSYGQMKQDFIVEMRTLSKLRHPCITTVMGSVIDQKEEPMLVMEYMENGSLFDLLHNPSIAIEGELIGPILQDIARGARFLHASDPKVIHGDLKAANVLVDGRFHAKIADFGLSSKKKYLGAAGTAYWMAPELVRGASGNSAASDVYSFGVTLYELYSRRIPYEGEDPTAVLDAIANRGKRPPIPEACPPKIAEIMKECFDGNPEKRPSFEEIDLRIQRLDSDNVEPGDIIVPHQLQKKRAERNEDLILQVFPKHIATALLQGKKVEPDRVDLATMFFSDIVGFTTIASSISADQVSDLLDRLYLKFDALSEKHDVFKIETIGDAYVGVCNLVKKQASDHAKRIAEFAIDAVAAAAETPVLPGDPSAGTVRIRVGVHCGPLVARVVGSRNPRYCVFGDTVNTAARMESNSMAMRIQCSDRAAEMLRVQCPELPLESRGMIHIKGKGEMSTFFIAQERSRSKAFRRRTS